ncbi:c-type cytochrome [Cytophaga sp. FL35]|uniref:DUF7133 domain-containing protein n=1 Tax=Cytophaga sp. FL35 TaxID=1904456 RepID=UPI0025706DF7|nr:c-type cytochrome [Cytophaga sp. FL35]
MLKKLQFVAKTYFQNRNRYAILMASLAVVGCQDPKEDCTASSEVPIYPTDSLLTSLNVPEGLEIRAFAGPDITPSPASMAVSATGEVFVGVDMMGSLGKEKGKGYIKRLVDCNNDGIMDAVTEFAQVDNPRGVLPVGEQVFVLHTRFSETTGKAENMDLIVFNDTDNDGIADGPAKVLIKNLSNPKYLRERGTDHATNGIQMGIDGWIYIAVGDFGFYNATGTDGRQLTSLGGGVLRVRPDGTEMEMYTHGLRNIYDVAIDPFMNIYTRGNTNDGGGWNIRFIHQIQSGEYGYPVLFKNFTEEILPALVDVGGGSGVGALYLDDDRWPTAYNKVPLMGDWGRNHLFVHRVTKDGASFTQQEEKFLKLPQITDVDIDASGKMYLSAWDGAGYSGSPDKGFIVRLVPEGLKSEPFPDISKYYWTGSVVDLLESGSAKVRQSAQLELLKRGDGASDLLDMAKDQGQSLETRVAAIFTYAQLKGGEAIPALEKLTNDASVQEFALRALADRKPYAEQVSVAPFVKGLKEGSDRVKAAAVIGLGRLGKKEAAEHLLAVNVPSSFKAPKFGAEGPHATPNSEMILPHLAVKALVQLKAVDECIKALGSPNEELALWAMRYMHQPKVVTALMEAYKRSSDAGKKEKLLHSLARIYYKEAPYDTSWWWGTRPDTRGPYYKTQPWAETERIQDFLKEEWMATQADDKELYALLNTKYRLDIEDFGVVDTSVQAEEPQPVADLEKIKNKKGQVGEASIEDVMIAMKQIPGDPEKGSELFRSQACNTCHSLKTSEVMKGPFMGQIGSIMNREQITESILKPNASISQGFATVQVKTKEGKMYIGFVTQESADDLTLTNIAGIATQLKKTEITSRKELENSMMPTGLANALSYEELASLISFLEKQK